MSNFRITTNAMYRMYRANLNTSRNALNDAMTRVETQRSFNTYYEDPSGASRAFQTRRSMWRTDDQISNTKYLISKYQVAYTAVDTIVDGAGEDDNNLDGIADSLRGLTGTAGAGRSSIGQSLSAKADSIVKMMNVQFGDEFVFAGADGLNVPFSWSADKSTLLYREAGGKPIDVNTPPAEDAAKNPSVSWESYQEENPEATRDDWLRAQYEEQFGGEEGEDGERVGGYSYADGLAMQKMLDEATYVDIGLGLKFDAEGNVYPFSAYNSSLSGVKFLGCGLDEDGDSKNLAVLMDELGAIFSATDPGTGDYQAMTVERNGFAYTAEEAEERAGVLVNKVLGAIDRVKEQHVKLSTDANYLRTNLTQLEETRDVMNEQLLDIEQEDPAKSITSMVWAQYSYNAALRIGTNILSQSLIDYMS